MAAAAKVMDTVIAIGLGLIVAVALIAGALTNFFSTVTSTWSTSVASVWSLVAILAVLAIALGFFYAVRGSLGHGKRGMASIFMIPRFRSFGVRRKNRSEKANVKETESDQ
jgi:hypothetical protein